MAVLEERTLRFDAGGLAHALQLYPRIAARIGVSYSPYCLITFSPERQEIRILNPLIGGGIKAVSATHVAPLLVEYSSIIGVPLPRNAAKRIMVELNAVVFSLSIRHRAEPEPEPCGAHVWERGIRS